MATHSVYESPVEVEMRVLRPQAEMVTCQAKWAAARGGTGSGKTFGWCIATIDFIQNFPKANAFVVGADYEQLRRGFFDSMLTVLEAIGWEVGVDYIYRESPSPMIRFPKLGARLRSLSAKLAQRIRSVEFQWLILEEPPTWHDAEEVYRVLVGRMRHNKRTADAYGTTLQPRGRMSFNPPAEGTWLHELIETRWKAAGYPCWRMSVRNNHLMLGVDEYVRDLEIALDPSRWPSEIDGYWSTAGGNVCSAFDSKIHLSAPDGMPAVDAIDETKPLLWSHDFNVALMCSIIAQPYTQTRLTDGFAYHDNRPPTQLYRFPIAGWQRRVIRVIGELAIPDAGTPNVFRAFMEKYGDIARRTGVVLFGDASGGARIQSADSASSGRTNWLDLETRLRKAGITVSLHIPKANPSEIDGINEMNAQFGTGEGYGVTINGPECPVLLKDIREVKRGKNGKIEKLPGTLLTHMLDSLRYVCHRQRALGRLADLKAREKKRGQTTIFMNR